MTELVPYTANFGTIAELSDEILHGFADQRTGDAIMAMALTISRLMYPNEDRTPEDDIKFVTDLLDWANLRLVPTEGKPS